MTPDEWLRIADGWRDTDEAPGELIRALADEVERMRAIERRLRQMHAGDAEGDCKECEMYYPCPTVRALDGEL